MVKPKVVVVACKADSVDCGYRGHMDATAGLFFIVALVCFGIVAIGLKTGRTPGIAFRSRFIARRKEEPALFACSLWMFAIVGLLLLYAVVSVGLGWHWGA